MWLITMKGMPGCGKSVVSRALSKQLGCPVIDKDDIKDILDGHTSESGPLAYETMFNVARRQLLQKLDAICDSPLTFRIGYEKAWMIATETHASLVIVECICSNELEWSQRIDGRKRLQLSAHHQTDWDTFQASRPEMEQVMDYPIAHPHLIVDTARPLDEIVAEIARWLGHLSEKEIGKTHQEIQAAKQWTDPAGSWSDLPKTVLEDLDQIRRSSQLTPPLEDL